MSKKGNEGVPSTTLKFEKSATRMSQRGGYPKMRSYERLTGGADAKSKSSVTSNKSVADTNPKVTPVASEISKAEPEAQEEIESIHEESSPHLEEKITGDKKVNEMIDYVIHNLQEAGKALASLGENFEHELKLMLVDIMGKVQNWVSLAQIRLDEAKNDLDSLRRELGSRSDELASRDREMADLKAKLNEAEVSKIAYETALAENIQRSRSMLQSPTAKTFVQSPEQSGTLPEHDPGEPSQLLGTQPTASLDADPRAEYSAELDARVGVISEKVPLGGVSSKELLSAPDGMTSSPSDPTQDKEQRSQPAGTLGSGQTGPSSTIDVAVQSGRSKDRAKRSSDLESEVSRLKKENERIIREKNDYENAIQRALLRGVSSLNAETLRVLKCPPGPCYAPCRASLPPVNSVETMTVCPSKKTCDNWTPRGGKTASNATQSIHGNIRTKSNVATVPEQENNYSSTKMSSTGINRSCPRQKKCSVTSNASMVFLLHQAEASSVCAPGNTSRARPCARAKLKKHDNSLSVKKLG